MAKKKTCEDALFHIEEAASILAENGFQWGDILSLVYGYLMVHLPDAREQYLDGSSPDYYYGPQKTEKK